MLSENREPRLAPPESPAEHKPFQGLGEDAAEYRQRFDRMLNLTVGAQHEMRRNEDGSKTAFIFLAMDTKTDAQEIMKLREAAALAGVREAFTPLVVQREAGAAVHLGWEETIPQDALPGHLQDPPWSQPEHENTRETPL
ncbi:hypothetical protein [Streptomyces eurythermus]